MLNCELSMSWFHLVMRQNLYHVQSARKPSQRWWRLGMELSMEECDKEGWLGMLAQSSFILLSMTDLNGRYTIHEIYHYRKSTELISVSNHPLYGSPRSSSIPMLSPWRHQSCHHPCKASHHSTEGSCTSWQIIDLVDCHCCRRVFYFVPLVIL